MRKSKYEQRGNKGLFRLRPKRSDSQVPPADSEPESTGRLEIQPAAAAQGDEKGGSVVESTSGEQPDLEPRLDLALRELGEYLAGGREPGRIDPTATIVREAVAKELLAVISGAEPKTVPSSNNGSASNGNHQAPHNEFTPAGSAGSPQTADDVHSEQHRARQLFIDHGFFDEAIDRLAAAPSPGERAAAARTIGIVGIRLGNVPLLAALFDDALEVRDAATEALARLGHPAASHAETDHATGNDDPTTPLTNELADKASLVELAKQELVTADDSSSRESEAQSVPADEAKLLLDEEATRKALETLQQRLDDAASSRLRLEKEAGLKLESEARLMAEAATRHREAEDLRQRAEDEARRRKIEEEEKFAAAHVASVQAEEEANRLRLEDARLRLEVNKLRVVAEELARTRADMKSERAAAVERARLAETARARQEAAALHQEEMERLRSEEEALRSSVAEAALRRAEVESARLEADRETQRLAAERDQLALAEAARRAEADCQRRDAAERSRDEQEQLLAQVEGMRRLAEEVGIRRAEVEAARQKAIEDAQRLVESQARMRAAEESRQQDEAAQLQLEAELVQRAEEQRRLLDEVRLRAQEEQRQVEEGERYRAAEQEQRLAQLATLRQRMEAEAQQRTENERQLSSQIESFRISEMQARKRIEDAEARRRTAEERYRLTAEKMQRVEAEARKGEIEEERILARLEEVRRNVAVATQLAVEQEKRIKDETEQLRRLEETQRQRLEEAARNRVEAEHRWQQEKDRLQLEEGARVRASEKLKQLLEEEPPEMADDVGEWRDDPAENLRPSKAASSESRGVFGTATGFAAASGRATSPVYEDIKSGGALSGSNGNSSEVANASDQFAPVVGDDNDEFAGIAARFDHPSPEVRNAAARELRGHDPQRMIEWLNRTLDEASPERRRNIGSAIAASGLAAEVIDLLGGERREDTYSALCLLLTMAKGGEVKPLIDAIEHHQNVYVRIAAVRLLTLNGQEEVANAAARRRLGRL